MKIISKKLTYYKQSYDIVASINNKKVELSIATNYDTNSDSTEADYDILTVDGNDYDISKEQLTDEEQDNISKWVNSFQFEK